MNSKSLLELNLPDTSPMTKAECILETLKAHLPELREMGVKDLYVFGSVARGEADPHDVDVLVEFSIIPGLVKFIQLKEAERICSYRALPRL